MFKVTISVKEYGENYMAQTSKVMGSASSQNITLPTNILGVMQSKIGAFSAFSKRPLEKD